MDSEKKSAPTKRGKMAILNWFALHRLCVFETSVIPPPSSPPFLSVKRISVSVLPLLELDLDVDPPRVLLGERKVGLRGPDVERLSDFGVDVRLGEAARGRVLADLVRKVLHAPATA
jgi:hypothetical protein